MRIFVRPYNESFCETWDEFVRCSRNATFLFRRAFMDYHRDRFVDASLLLFDEKKYAACFVSGKPPRSRT